MLACLRRSLPDDLLLGEVKYMSYILECIRDIAGMLGVNVSLQPRDQFHSFCTKSVGGLCLPISMC